MSSQAIRSRPGAETATKYVGGTVSVVKSTQGANGRKVYTFLATTESVDRDGEIITADGWDFAAFERNPVILDGHDYYSGCKAVVGRAVSPLRRVEAGWEVDVEFAPTEEGKRVELLVDGGFIKAVSVGFMPKKIERAKGEPPKHTEKELLEISVVPIPSNRDALRVASFSGIAPVDNLAVAYLNYLAEGNPALSDAEMANLKSLANGVQNGTLALGAVIPPDSTGKTIQIGSLTFKAADFDATLAAADREEACRDRRWDINRALNKALTGICEDADLTAEGKVSAADVVLGQYHAAMLDWFKALVAMPVESVESVVEYLAAPDATVKDVKSGREISAKNEKMLGACRDDIKAVHDKLDGLIASLAKPTEDMPKVFVVTNAKGLRVGDTFNTHESAEDFAAKQVNADMPNSPYLVTEVGEDAQIVNLATFEHHEKTQAGVLRTILATGEVKSVNEISPDPSGQAPAQEGTDIAAGAAKSPDRGLEAQTLDVDVDALNAFARKGVN